MAADPKRIRIYVRKHRYAVGERFTGTLSVDGQAVFGVAPFLTRAAAREYVEDRLVCYLEKGMGGVHA